jgi:F-box-like
MHLDALPDDILLTIIRWLTLSSAHPGHYQLPYGDWEHPLVSISTTNRRLRQVAIPWLYRHIEIKGLPGEMFVNGCRVSGSWEKASAHAQGMVHCRSVMRHVRYVQHYQVLSQVIVDTNIHSIVR